MSDEPVHPPPESRKRGAQPGNQNALKHGLYSRNPALSQTQVLESSLAEGLESEIIMLRLLMRALYEQASSSDEEELDLQQMIKILGALGTGTVRLSKLLRTQQALGVGEGSKLVQNLSQTLREVAKELGAK